MKTHESWTDWTVLAIRGGRESFGRSSLAVPVRFPDVDALGRGVTGQTGDANIPAAIAHRERRTRLCSLSVRGGFCLP